MELKQAILRERLELYLSAERAILSGAQSYTIGDRELRRGDLKEIRAEITQLLEELSVSELKPGRVKRAVLVD